ncbi:MAG: universal stress protein [Burkholderiales bacterium]|nr:universal stress protein [Burkholderiales bacterium]
MSTIGSLLIATDFSEDSRAAASRGAQLAAELGARLALLHVMSGPYLGALRESFGLAAEADAKLIDDARRQLSAMANEIAGVRGLAPTAQVRVGHVVNEILSACAQADMLVLGAHGVNPLRDLILGTTAERLLKRNRRPTLVVKRPPQGPYRRVLVPVDFSAHSPVALRCAMEIAPEAEVTVIHAFENPYEGKLWVAGVSDEQIRDYRQLAQQQALGRIDELLLKSGDPYRCARSVVRGDAAPVIVAKEAELGVDLIVIGKHGQTLTEELLIGSVTRHVLSDSKCDVLVVREQHGAEPA